MTRPTALTVIGWGAIWLGLLGVFSGGISLFIAYSMGDPSPAATEGSGPEDFVLRHLSTFAILQVIVSIFVIVSGGALLRLRLWGARVIESVASLVLAYGASFTVYFVYRVVTEAPLHAHSANQRSEVVRLLLGAAFILMLYTVPLLAVVRRLRNPHVRGMLA